MSNEAEDNQAKIDEIIAKLDIKTGVGDPSSPYFGKLLTAEEEAKIDPSGAPIVDGETWGSSGTGLYLTIAVAHRGGFGSSTVTLGGSVLRCRLRGYISLVLQPVASLHSTFRWQGHPLSCPLIWDGTPSSVNMWLSGLGTPLLRR